MSTSSSNSSSSNSAPLTAFTTTHEPESMPVVLPSTTDSGLASVKTEVPAGPFTSDTSCPGIRCRLSDQKADNFYFQDFEKTGGSDEQMEVSLSMARRFLSGPGSSPPRCTSKCGNCTPCKPVHVAMPPGTPVTAEYYPEAWRCKCGNRLYMP
ncbi:hypothetical protein OIU84_026885 [Salix udensis]|uniref:Epidermal patterning factor-like protein n=1 Tax=Salix udensis TaxID=889485 RepID=A0AAD6KG02_9ROSI|nr:hypothetical protein OIU84_026885 [Salix udensis]